MNSSLALVRKTVHAVDRLDPFELDGPVGEPAEARERLLVEHAALAGDPEKAKSFNDAVEAALPIMEKMTAGTATDEEIERFSSLNMVDLMGASMPAGLPA